MVPLTSLLSAPVRQKGITKPAGGASSSMVGSALSQTVTELFVCRLSGSKVGDHRKGTSFPLTTQRMKLMKTRACVHIQYSQGYYNLSEVQNI